MRDVERRVLRLIIERSGPITARELAASAGVSERSVRTYVRSINEQAGVVCVESGRMGYWYRSDAARRLMERDRGDAVPVPQTNAERCTYVVNRLLHSPAPVSAADLSEEMFVSTSTMGTVLTRARRRLNSFELVLEQRDGRLSVRGTEKNKRRALGELLYDEASASFLDIATIQRAFPDIDAERIRSIVIDALDRQRLFVNGYSLVNVVLHIAIAIDRIRNGGSTCGEAPGGDAPASAHDLSMAAEIADALSGEFDVPFPRDEQRELALLLSTHATRSVGDPHSDEELRQIVGDGCLSLVDKLLGGIESYYFISLSEREFYVRFALHVKSLLARADRKSFSRNPLTAEIRTTCPLLYDSGVYAASVIAAETGYVINEDEIAYLAFHLGSALEAQRQLSARVRCVLFCPAYYDLDKNLQRFLERRFPDDILICDVATTFEEIGRTPDAELVVASAPLQAPLGLPVCHIGIAPREADVSRIRSLLSRIQLEKRRARFRELLEQLVAPELFGVAGGSGTREEAIDALAGTLEREGYVEEGYRDVIWERERLSSTSFGQVAIPHALRPHALRSGIAVMVPERPIRWGESTASLVLMLSFSLRDRAVLNELFDPLVSVLVEPAHVVALTRAQSRDEFIALLCDLME